MIKKNLIFALTLTLMAGWTACSDGEQVNEDEEPTGQMDTTNGENDQMTEDGEEVSEDDVREEIIEEEGVYFLKGSWSQALSKAQKTGKPIFLDAYADWCRPCKEMDREVFSRRDVGTFFNENFVSVKLNIEEGDGLEISKKYEINEIPTYLFFNSEGELMDRTLGKKSPEVLISEAKEAAGIEG